DVLVGQPAEGPAGAEGEDVGGDGLDVAGAITLRRLSLGELDLTVTPREFLAMDTRTYQNLVLGAGPEPIRLTGTLAAPVLRGSVVLSRGDIFVTDELVPPDLEPVELTSEQIETVETRFGRDVTARDTTVNRFVAALDYDISVGIERNVWIRSDAGLPFDIEFSGEVEASKRPFAKDGQLFGQIELVRGTIQTLNRRFEVDRGGLTFNGSALSAIVDLEASLDVRLAQTLSGQSSVTILLAVNGQLDDSPEVRLSSAPALDPADIVSIIATGQLSDNFGTGSLGSTGAGIGLGFVSGIAEGLASESLGLDLAQVDIESDGSIVIRVGKYLTNRIFLTAGFIPSSGSGGARAESDLPIQVTLDYELLQWLQAQTEYSGQRGLGGGASAEISF
ncbi:MAG TPA: translocation/assembly module TamB domain-containing protein, partial [Rubricoccaceae bacterium]